MLSYNEIIKVNRDFADAHKVIKTFENGETWQSQTHNQQAKFKYPLMFMEDLPSSLSESGRHVFTFRVWFHQQVPTLQEKGSDTLYTVFNEAKSDMEQCARDLIAYWTQDTNYELLTIDGDFTLNPFIAEGQDTTTGYYFDLKMAQVFNFSSCVIPMNGVPTPPENDVDITVNSTAFTSVACGDDYNVVVKDTDGNLVGSKIGSEWIVSAGGAPVANSMNGTGLTDADPGTTKTFVIRYADDSSVVVTTISDSATAFIGEVPNPDPATNSMNAVELTDIPAGGDKDFTIRYADDSPVVVTTITDNATTFIGEVPNIPVTPDPVLDMLPSKSGAADLGSFATGDDGDENLGGGVDFFTLDNNNPFGNTAAFTGTTGGYWNGSAWVDSSGTATTEALAFPNDVCLNWKTYNGGQTVLAIIRTPEVAASHDAQLALQPWTYDTYSNWKMLTRLQGEFYVYCGVSRNPFNYAPLSVDITASADQIWSSYKDTSGGAWRWSTTNFTVVSKGGLRRAFVGRWYTLTELGL